MKRNREKIIKKEKKTKMKAAKKIIIKTRMMLTKMRINQLIALNDKKLHLIQIQI